LYFSISFSTFGKLLLQLQYSFLFMITVRNNVNRRELRWNELNILLTKRWVSLLAWCIQSQFDSLSVYLYVWQNPLAHFRQSVNTKCVNRLIRHYITRYEYHRNRNRSPSGFIPSNDANEAKRTSRLKSSTCMYKLVYMSILLSLVKTRLKL